MYQTYWGLREPPFQAALDVNSFYRSPIHEEALARLNFLVDQHRRLGLLVGPSGSGKSMVLEVFARELRRTKRTVAVASDQNRSSGAVQSASSSVVFYPRLAKLSLLDLEPTEMLWQLASQWGLKATPATSTAALWRMIEDRLTEYRCQQLGVVVLLDDVSEADRGVLQHVARLARLDPSPSMWFTIVLTGRNEGMTQIGNSLLDLADLRIDLEPWARDDTEEFVTTRLSQAGQCSQVFNESAVDRLHELAHGIPRRVSQLADLALLAAAGQNLNQIDAEVVETVYQELGIGCEGENESFSCMAGACHAPSV
jgi:general secretion pathway protein A